MLSRLITLKTFGVFHSTGCRWSRSTSFDCPAEPTNQAPLLHLDLRLGQERHGLCNCRRQARLRDLALVISNPYNVGLVMSVKINVHLDMYI